MKKRILSILLVCCMVLTLLPTPAFAAEVETGARASNPGGLCEHHPEHDEACGYTEGTAEIPCSHEHTEECHSLITRCVHAHTAECYTAESVSENADGLSEAENAAPTECVHACTEKSGCILQTSDCKHAHGKDCGYAPASMGSPAPMYVRFAIPRTEKRQCLCSGQPVPLPPNTPIRCITMPTAAAVRRQVKARPARNYLYGFPYQKKFQPVTGIPSRVGRIARMRIRDIFAKRDIIGIT